MASLPDGTTITQQTAEGWNLNPPSFSQQVTEGWNLNPPSFTQQTVEGWDFLSSDLGTVTVTQTDTSYSGGGIGARFTDAGGQLDTLEICGDAPDP